jgi:hypothetical protein
MTLSRVKSVEHVFNAGRKIQILAKKGAFSACIFRKMVFICAMLWILTLVLLAAGVGFGLRIGVIAASVSFLGLIIATLLADLVGKLFKLILPHVGFENPVLTWMASPICGFLLIWVLFNAVGFEAQRRVGVFYKYKAGDLRQALWERLNMRLGACVGVLVGTSWIILVSFFVFNVSYLTAQVAPGESEARMTRIVNGLGYDLQSTGMDKAARAVGSVPDTFYKTANFAGLLVQNPDLSARLGTYPAFLSLAERDDIQSLAQDGGVMDQWKQGAAMGSILNNDQIKNLIKDTNLVATVWSIIQTNMDDITNYLFTGQSPKYDPIKIVGRWNFDLVPALLAERQKDPKMRPEEMKALRAAWTQAFAQTTFVAGTAGQAFLKGIPDFTQKPPSPQTWTGIWSGGDTSYDLSLSYNGQTETATASTDGLRLTIKMGKFTYVFQRVY